MMKPLARIARIACLAGIASVALYGPSCDDGGGAGGAGGSDLADVVFEGGATDEALEAMLSATPKQDPSKKAIFDAPQDGAELPASPIATFSWHTGTSASRSPIHRSAPRSRWALGGLVGPERSALAHGDPLNGNAFFLVFSTDSNPKLHRVFTTSTSYTPGDAAWKTLQGAGGPITVTITSGIFDNNTLASDGGPFEGGSITITVKP